MVSKDLLVIDKKRIAGIVSKALLGEYLTRLNNRIRFRRPRSNFFGLTEMLIAAKTVLMEIRNADPTAKLTITDINTFLINLVETVRDEKFTFSDAQNLYLATAYQALNYGLYDLGSLPKLADSDATKILGAIIYYIYICTRTGLAERMNRVWQLRQMSELLETTEDDSLLLEG